MIDSARKIKYKTFIRYVNIKELETMLGYTNSPLRIKNDYSVTFYRSKYNGQAYIYIYSVNQIMSYR